MTYTSIGSLINAAEIREVANDAFRSELVTNQIPED